ncbi:MAG: hypothetical protein R2809_12840 [Flavobacteriales bacterium]
MPSRAKVITESSMKTVEGPERFRHHEGSGIQTISSTCRRRRTTSQLIIIDGGKGQLGAALESLGQLGLRGRSPLLE